MGMGLGTGGDRGGKRDRCLRECVCDQGGGSWKKEGKKKKREMKTKQRHECWRELFQKICLWSIKGGSGRKEEKKGPLFRGICLCSEVLGLRDMRRFKDVSMR